MSRWKTEPDPGDTETEIGIRLAIAVPDLLLSATAVATTLTLMFAGMGLGAVYIPEEVMVPQLAPAHPEEASDHATAEFEDPWTEAVNCCVAAAIKFALDGEMVTEIA